MISFTCKLKMTDTIPEDLAAKDEFKVYLNEDEEEDLIEVKKRSEEDSRYLHQCVLANFMVS